MIFFPISSERVYEDYWYKFAQDNNLVWLKLFQTGVVLEQEYFVSVKNELLLFLDFIINTSDEYYLEEKYYITERINLFIQKINEAMLLRENIELYIG